MLEATWVEVEVQESTMVWLLASTFSHTCKVDNKLIVYLSYPSHLMDLAGGGPAAAPLARLAALAAPPPLIGYRQGLHNRKHWF